MEPLRSGDPRRISSYEILNRLGAGGMGQVYLGRSPSGRRVAVKVIRPELTNDPTFRQRFRREVATMRQVSGFFTAPVVDADPDGDPAWLATAFVPGPSLESAVAEGGPMPPQDVLMLAAGLAEALNAIHREGLTHRDLKPGNVLMADDGPRVIDFGLAVAAESVGLTQAGTVVGTPAFMSPEQVSGGHVGPASDVWSLGAVLVYAATGAAPFGEGTTMEVMLRVMNGTPDLSALSGTLGQLVSACMMKDPNARPTPARILQVLSEGAGVQATMVQVPADAAAEPVWPTGEAAAPGSNTPASNTPAPAWDTGQTASPAPNPSPAAPSQPSTPAWGSGPVSGPNPGPTPAASTWASPGAPSQPPAPAWGSGPNPAASPSSAWGSGPNPTASASPAWGTPSPVSGPSTPPHPTPSVPGSPWPTASGQQPSPTYQSAPPTQHAQAASPWMQPQPSPPYGVPVQPAPVKKNRNGLIAAVGIAVVAVVGGGIAVFASGGGSGGSSGGSSGGTLGGAGTIGPVTPIAANFPLSSLVTDADAAQYLKATPTAAAPTDDSTDDPTTFDKDWVVGSSSSELRVQASNYKSDSQQAKTDFVNHTSTLATDAPFEDEGALGNSDKTAIQVATDHSSGLQHCQIEILRGGLDVHVAFVESGSAAGAHTDVVNLAKLIAGRLPAK
jgi:serine/threonine protein kinase